MSSRGRWPAAASSGRLEEAREHADRCRAIVAGGEDWRGRAGVVGLADAVVRAHEGRAAAAERYRRHQAGRSWLERIDGPSRHL